MVQWASESQNSKNQPWWAFLFNYPQYQHLASKYAENGWLTYSHGVWGLVVWASHLTAHKWKTFKFPLDQFKFNFDIVEAFFLMILLHFSTFFSIQRYRSKLLRGHSSDTSGPRSEDWWMHNLLLHIRGRHMADRASGHLQ